MSVTVTVSAVVTALPVVFAAKVASQAGVDVTVSVGPSVTPYAEAIESIFAAVSAKVPALSLSPADVPASEAAFFKQLALVHLVPAGKIPEIFASLDSHLALRASLTGSTFTGLDVAAVATILGNVRAVSLIATPKAYPNVHRWFVSIYGAAPDALLSAGKPTNAALPAYPSTTVTDAVLAITLSAAAAAAAEVQTEAQLARAGRVQQSAQGSMAIDLPGAVEGKVVTRFPPEPSGYLHIGHVKALILNHYFAEAFKGKMLLRFDDTNPSKEKDEYVDNIMADLKTLGVTWVGPTYTSDMIPEFYDYGRKIIRAGKAYADNTPVDKMREERLAGVESKCRKELTVEQNLEIFEKMIKGEERDYCIRARISMQHLVGCMRDPVLFRTNDTPHHRQGTRFICYPTYDFACPIIDSVEGVTHALRTTEYHDRNEQYNWVCDACEIRRPAIWDFSRLNFQYTLLSKRKLQSFVDRGLVEGWFDPRFPTMQGILRRGLLVETLKEFMISQGASKNINLMEWEKLWALNKAKLEPTARRYYAVDADTKVPLELTDIAAAEDAVVPLHPKNADIGTKTVVKAPTVYLEGEDAATLAAGQEITLVSWGNVIITDVVKRADGSVEKVVGKTNPEGDVSATPLKAHWVGARSDADLVKLTLIEYGHLINVAKIEEGMDTDAVLNQNSKRVKQALGEPALAGALKVNDIIQLQRKGFYRVDKAPSAEAPEQALELILIPDGKKGCIKTA